MDLLPIVVAVVAGAAFVQGFLGFGFGILSMGILIPITGYAYTSPLINVISLATPLAILWRLRRDIHFPLVRDLLPITLVGIVIGVVTASYLSSHMLEKILGTTIVGFSVWSLVQGGAGRAVRRLWAIPAGLVSGICGGAFNMGGPPLIAYIYRQPLSPEALKSSLQCVFIVADIVRLGLIISRGQVTAGTWRDAGISLVPVIVFSALGVRAAGIIAPVRFRRVAWGAFLLMGLWLALRP